LSRQVDRFYLDLLDGSTISISEVSEGFDSASATGDAYGEHISAGLRVLFEKLPGELKDITWYAREFLKRKPAIVHTWLDYTNAKAGIAAAVVGVPRIVLSTRSVPPNQFGFFQPYMREAYRVLAARPGVCLLNNSEAGARDYERWLGLPLGTVKVIRNGFDFSMLQRAEKVRAAQELRARLGIVPETPLVGSVMRFSEEKRPLLWIEVAARVLERRPDIMFLMVGDGPLWEEARRLAKAHGLENRILLPGYEKQAAVAIAAMDVLLLTSRVEGLPNVLLEAQALGVPVVTTRAGGVAETLIQGTTGYVISPPSRDLLANTVLQILADTAWREKAGQVAYKFVRERFSMSRMIDSTIDAYFARGEFAETPALYRAVRDIFEGIP
jgi:glycosyltransferase involved in cell wall biosynthesis